MGLESEIANVAGRKTGLIIPFWLADILQDRPYLPIWEQNTAMGGGFFWDLVTMRSKGVGV